MNRRSFNRLTAVGTSITASSLSLLGQESIEDMSLIRTASIYRKAFPAHIPEGLVREGKKAYLMVGKKGGGSQKILLEDGVKGKNHSQLLNTCDLVETLQDLYPLSLPKTWPTNLDPGRYRVDSFMKAVYGNSPEEVKSQLVKVPFVGQTMYFHQANGVAERYARVGVALEKLATKKPALKKYFTGMGGSFNWRNIAGTNRLSSHSFGITVDLNPNLGGYWKWDVSKDLGRMERRLNYPQDIVEIFEAEQIIWGGKWYHYDLMHFEFRPELFAALESQKEKKPPTFSKPKPQVESPQPTKPPSSLPETPASPEKKENKFFQKLFKKK